jgi:hypothetical protein
MSYRRKIPDALMVPFTLGLILGGAATGLVFVGLGGAERLLGEATAIGYQKNRALLYEYAGGWFFLLLGSVFVAMLLELILVGLGSLFSRSSLTPRLRPLWLLLVGTVAACVCTVVSWLTIDLRPHPELPFYQGPSLPFFRHLILVCAIAPFVLLKRAPPSVEPNTEPSMPRRETA